MTGNAPFQPVNDEGPCVICGKPDWCRRTADGAHECKRIHESSIDSLVRIATTPEGYSVYREAGDRRTVAPVSSRPFKRENQSVVRADFGADARKFRAALSTEHKVLMARQLGVSVAALEAIGIGCARADDLRRLRAGGKGWREAYPVCAASFPECDATGTIVGFSFRTDDGRKGSPSGKVGAKRGLIIPSTLPTKRDPVLLVEGPSDVAACETLGLAAVGRPSNMSSAKRIAQLLARRDVLVVGENDQNPAGIWPGREGAQKLATQLAATWKRPVRWTLPPDGQKDTRAYLQHLVANGLDPNEQAACHEAGGKFLDQLVAVASEERTPASKSESSHDERGAREVVLRLCDEAGDHFFHDNECRAFAVVRDGAIARTMPVKSREYGLLLGHRYFESTGAGLPTTAKTEAIATLEGRAIFKGPEETVFLRIGEHEGRVVLDLCDSQWRVVIVSKDGWEVVAESPIRFRRTRGMLALPVPIRGGSLKELRRVLNVSTDESFTLVCAFILCCLNPRGPYFILLINGEPGSAKSTLCRLIRALFDPNKAPLRSAPKDNRDLAIAANNAWIVALDNMSRIDERTSNALCRLATGGGFGTRELYSDGDESLFDAKRPVIINGIGEVADRSDLIDRAIRLALPTIPEDQRRTELALQAEYERLQPGIIGALLDAVSAALRNQSEVKFTKLPRMADSASWVVAAESACPWPPGAFLEIWNDQRRESDEFVIESSPLAAAVRDRVERDGEIEGTATELLQLLSTGIDEKILKRPDWPKGPQALGTKLREVAPNLRRLGIEVAFGRGRNGRRIAIRKNAEHPGTPSSPSSLSTLARATSPEPVETVQGECHGDSVPLKGDSDRGFGDSDEIPDHDDESSLGASEAGK